MGLVLVMIIMLVLRNCGDVYRLVGCHGYCLICRYGYYCLIPIHDVLFYCMILTARFGIFSVSHV